MSFIDISSQSFSFFPVGIAATPLPTVTATMRQLFPVEIPARAVIGGHPLARAGARLNRHSTDFRPVGRDLPSVEALRQPNFIAATAVTTFMAGAMSAESQRVNALAPGYVDMTFKMRGRPELFNVWLDMTPMGHLGEPFEIAAATLYLASGASTYVTGAILSIDGGYTAWRIQVSKWCKTHIDRTALAPANLGHEISGQVGIKGVHRCLVGWSCAPRKLFRKDGTPIPISELDDDTAAMISAIEVDADGRLMRIRLWDKNAALEKAMKHLGLYNRGNTRRSENLSLQVLLGGADE